MERYENNLLLATTFLFLPPVRGIRGLRALVVPHVPRKHGGLELRSLGPALVDRDIIDGRRRNLLRACEQVVREV